MSDSTYEIYAVKYAHHDRPARDNFLGGDPHDDNMPLDYFVWAVVGKERSFIVDTGFDAEMGAKRGRQITRPPAAGLKALGLEPEAVKDVIVTHMHYDHAGNHTLFPHARYHLQDREMAYCTGRCMCHEALTHAYEPEDISVMIRRIFQGRVQFHDGDSQVAPGVSVHLVGGHTNGLQVVRVRTRRGWVVLASDASHLYANIGQQRPFPVVYNVGDMLEGYRRVHALADSEAHIIPGHDPAVLTRFPAARPGLEDWVVRLDADPVG
jgi:glyoxylase-like metal-dependent hydrolase (beta-lactamase superfamily II)